MELSIVTGYSGAGKTIALRALEDLGFFCIDNLPREVFASYMQLMQRAPDLKKIALGIDVRSGHDMDELVKTINAWRTNSLDTVKIIFLTAQPHTLIKRFQTTRRKHPLEDLDLASAIKQEKILLEPIRQLADHIIETDALNSHELRAVIRNICCIREERHMPVTLMSFGFKYGIPLESNFVYDLRSLPNPYFVPTLSGLSGTDESVQEYLFAQPGVEEFWRRLIDFALFAVEKSYQEGSSLITIGIGCTGGRHRSVAFVERLSQIDHPSCTFMVKHRDINKDTEQLL